MEENHVTCGLTLCLSSNEKTEFHSTAFVELILVTAVYVQLCTVEFTLRNGHSHPSLIFGAEFDRYLENDLIRETSKDFTKLLLAILTVTPPRHLLTVAISAADPLTKIITNYTLTYLVLL